MKDYKKALEKQALSKKKRAYVRKHFNDDKPTSIPRLHTKKVPLTKKEQWMIYNLDRPPAPRYQGLKGIYWYLISEYVRRRDFGMWGTCVSCGKKMDSWKQMQGGHFIAASTGGFELLFDMTNIHGECGYCNGFDPNHLIGYEATLDKRYGKGTAAILKKKYLKSRKSTPQKAWNDKEFDEAIRNLQAELILLE